MLISYHLFVSFLKRKIVRTQFNSKSLEFIKLSLTPDLYSEAKFFRKISFYLIIKVDVM
jgi:hypothetical protein